MNILPTTFALDQNYPNPFNARSAIRYQIPKAVQVELKIFNVIGQEIRTLVNEKQQPGYYDVLWDAKDNNGQDVSSGLYIYSFKAGEFHQKKKMLLLY